MNAYLSRWRVSYSFRGLQSPHGPHRRPGGPAEVKVNWRCNTKQWWVGAVPDAVAPSIYRKLGYTDDMIKLMGLDPSAPGCRTGADGPDIRPRGGEGDEGIVYPPITSDNVHGGGGQGVQEEELLGRDEARLLGAHGVRLGSELSHSMGAHPQDEGRDPGGLYVQVLQGVLARRGRGHSPPPDPGRQSHPSAGAGRAALQPLGQGTVGVLPPGRAVCPAAGCLRGGPESPTV